MPVTAIADAQAMTLETLATAVNKVVALKNGQAPSPNLQQVFDQMQAQGYKLGQPRRFRTSSVPGFTEWHINITTGHYSFSMAFYILEEV